MYVSVTTTKNGRAAIEYAEGKEQGHNGYEKRNLLVTPVNLLPDGKYADQMQKNWNKARKNHTTQIIRVVFSFSYKELDPDNEEDVLKANEIAKNFISKYYKDHNAVIYLQADGKGHKLHGHILINDVSYTDHRGCSNECKHVAHIRKWMNEQAVLFIDLDKGEKSNTKRTRTERALEEKAAAIRKKNEGKTEEEIREILISEKAYSYKADLRQRIHEAAKQAKDEEDFFIILEKSGVSATRRNSKKYGDYYTYELIDCPVNVKNKKARSYNLGYSFSPAGLFDLWNKKNNGTIKENITGFLGWLEKTGQNYMTFDDGGKLISADFDLMDRLHNVYEESLNNNAEEICDAPFEDMPTLKPATIKNKKKTDVEKQKKDLARRILNNSTENKSAQIAAEILRTKQRISLMEQELNINTEDESKQKERSLKNVL